MDELKPVVLGLKTSNDLLVKELCSVAKELAMKTAAVSLYQEELAKIKEKLRITNQRLTNANVKLSCIKTPDPVKRRMDTFDDDDDEPVAKQLKFGIELPSPLPMPSQGVDDMEDMEQEKDYSPKTNNDHPLFDALAQPTSSEVTTKASLKGLRLCHAIESLHTLQKLNTRQLHSSNISDDDVIPKKEKSKLRYCLELADYVITEDQRAELATVGLSEVVVKQLAYDIELSSFNKLYEFEGSDIGTATKSKRLVRATKTVSAMAGRVHKYKTLLAKNTTSQTAAREVAQISLIERQEYLTRVHSNKNPADEAKPQKATFFSSWSANRNNTKGR
ncbi:unnamed protein product [Cylindrotheca closterium]|uniref:Uncharacterized protein n=1 Tax=Cylindrotheca closterium TaxID=2856 RepID=A0AAD2G464_9STRA|nr:unnamed protein product [Cylindrotheca closterium]